MLRALSHAAARSDCNAFVLRSDGTCYGCLVTRDVADAGALMAALACRNEC
jgi:hypothetical protein